MANREAACHCGQLRLEVSGDPFAVSICNCLACQRRTGSAFGMQAAFKVDQVQVAGRFNDYLRVSDEADRKKHIFHFCPDCGSQVFYTEPTEPDLIVVSVGSFADPSFPPPTESGYDSRRHPWVGLPDSIQRFAPELWDPVRPLYEAGSYAEAADRGRELIEAHPSRRSSTTTWRAAKASRAGRPTPPSTYTGRSRCGTAFARWRRAIPTSTRYAPSPRSRN
jgi:hypothetical protein